MNRLKMLPSLLAGMLILAAGCDKGANVETFPMKIGTKTYNLEIAADEKSREHGLMERDTLASDGGMIFIFDTDTETSGFWMHHTRFDLDILFVDAQGKIVTAKTMKAYDESNTLSDGPYKYAIELPAGAANASGVKAGDVLTIPGDFKGKPTTAAATRP